VIVTSLEHNGAVTGITEGIAPAEISVNGVPVSHIAGTPLRGPLLLSTISGHVPRGDGQIGLGSTTMREAGVRVGSVVNVTVSVPTGGKRTVPFRVVSQISFPVVGGGIVSLGNGAAFTIAGYQAAACAPGPKHASCLRAEVAATAGGGLLVRFAYDPKGQAALNHYLAVYGSDMTL
jgi:hypothetical protein